jgi:lipoyl(octanoyl) transferase
MRRLHLVTYENGMAMQETLVARRQKEEIADQLLLLQHPPVITLGRGGKLENLLTGEHQLRTLGVRFYPTTRGGDITYHGPGQLVGYPILHLGEGSRDIRKYVTRLEEVLIRTVAEFGIETGRSDRNRGIWVGDRKLAAIGVRIARWVTSHGFALNVDPDMSHFQLITPCGIRDAGVVSMSELAGRRITLEELIAPLTRHFAELFDRELVERSHDLHVVKVLPFQGEQILLLRRTAAAGDFWQPVTGSIEPGESDEAAARRELFEETGQAPRTLTALSLRQSFLVDPEFLPGAEQPLLVDEVSFAAGIDSSEPIILDSEEHQEYGWFTLDAALQKIRWSNDRESIAKLQRNPGGPGEMAAQQL